ncbi:hypothetical protein E8E14_009891 [Neopestalotiopsis sp. 37M]|nr:hypothetical protein E8E14_009891 [Neopestalotiopsis sp. 37M]
MSAVTFNTMDIRKMDRKSPMVFLPLAPTTSGTSSVSQPAVAERPTARRTSSLSSTSSASASPPFRFLQLSPVQNGEDEQAIE